MRRLGRLAMLTVLLVSCGPSAPPEPPHLSGVWTGHAESFSLQLSIESDTDGILEGTAYISGPDVRGLNHNTEFKGTRSDGNVRVTIGGAPFETISYSGYIDDYTTPDNARLIRGSIMGSGIKGQALDLVRFGR